LAADRKEEYGIFFGLIIHVLVFGIAEVNSSSTCTGAFKHHFSQSSC
jgi:hypothetical protein